MRRSSRARQRWPFIKLRTYPNGTTAWMVDARTKNGGERKSFGSKVEAETFAEGCRTKRGNEGIAAFGNEELARRGKTVADAITFYLAHLRQEEVSVTIEAALAEMLEVKRAGGRTEGYCATLRQRIGRFVASFPENRVATFTAKQIDGWLAGLALAPGTRNTFRRDLRTLFSFCEKRGYCPTNEVRRTEIAKHADSTPGILTVKETAALLAACGPDLLPFVSIGAFAGLRTSEGKKLDWSEVNLDAGLIEVTAAKSKTAKRRHVKIAENLAAWIRPLAQPFGPVAPVGLRKRFEAVKKKAGLSASYHLAQHKDAAALALEMGNSPAMVFAHYRELVKPSEAAKFWALVPTVAVKTAA